MAIKNTRLTKKPSSRFSKYKWLIAIVPVIAILGALEWRGTINLFKGAKPTSGTIPSQPRTDSLPLETNKDTESEASTEPAPQSPKQDPQPTSSSGEAPVAPYGSFVSNHHPNLGGQPAPSEIVSVCTTTPGASCYIEFTNKDGIVKKLDAQIADGSGTAYWQWDIKKAGFTAGSWGIKAVATLNSKTTSATDAQNLEVEP